MNGLIKGLFTKPINEKPALANKPVANIPDDEIGVAGSSTEGTEDVGAQKYGQPGVKQEDVSNAVDDAKKDFITIFGLFAALLIFLSVQVQIFQSITKFSYVVGVSSFIMAAILSFALAIHAMFNYKENQSRYWPLVIVILAFLFISAASFLWGIEHSLAFWKLFKRH